uniref:RING-CH-type domain-containing protein n=1 Tax=Ananas comosus var. bracteatus TaxID=296719 RepID=A0A6V7QVJ6_ANACO
MGTIRIPFFKSTLLRSVLPHLPRIDSEQGDELISPCMCKGTQQFVHRSCLDHWRSVKVTIAFSHCTTCKAQFHLRVEQLEDDSCRKMKFRFFVARDVLLVFLLVQIVIAIIGGFAYYLDQNGNFRNSFSDSWDRILSKHPIPFYYCIGVVVFFVMLGFSGPDSSLLVLQQQRPLLSGVPQLLLRVGHPRLLPSFNGGLLCPLHHFRRRLCHSWNRL